MSENEKKARDLMAQEIPATDFPARLDRMEAFARLLLADEPAPEQAPQIPAQ